MPAQAQNNGRVHHNMRSNDSHPATPFVVSCNFILSLTDTSFPLRYICVFAMPSLSLFFLLMTAVCCFFSVLRTF